MLLHEYYAGNLVQVCKIASDANRSILIIDQYICCNNYIGK
jgi:hypothetical protein